MTLNASGISPLLGMNGVASSAFGQYTGDGSGAITVALGFTPIWVKIFDTTDNTTWEWCAGMAATDSIKIVGSGPVQTVDGNSAVLSNHVITTYNTTGVYAPGTSGPGDGTLINTSVTVDAPSLTTPQLILGSTVNTSAKLYSWVALG
jgi:hypothetical protein